MLLQWECLGDDNHVCFFLYGVLGSLACSILSWPMHLYEVSEKQCCDLAAAFRDELLAVTGVVSSAEFVEAAARLHDTGHENRLPQILTRHGLQADVAISEAVIGLKAPHPYLKLSHLVKCMDREGKIASNLLMNHTAADYEKFWTCFKTCSPHHAVFKVHGHRLGRCIPCMLHADEGATLKKKALMILSSHPVLGHGTRRPDSTDMNFSGNTFVTRYLFSVLLARAYAKKSMVLHELVGVWAADWCDVFNNGIATGSHGQLFLIPLGVKGDWPALSKVGRLTRHFLRDSPYSRDPPGICHRCAAGKKGFPWHEFNFDSAWLINDEPVALPWKSGQESHLCRIPQDESNLPNFFLVDLFHTCHKGIVGDYVASALDAWTSL